MQEIKYDFVIVYTDGVNDAPHTQVISSNDSREAVKMQFKEKLGCLNSKAKVLGIYSNSTVCDAIRLCEKQQSLRKKLFCTVCGGEIIHSRVEDSDCQSRVFHSGAVVPIGIKTNGYDLFVCSNDHQHVLSEEMQEMLINHIDSFNW